MTTVVVGAGEYAYMNVPSLRGKTFAGIGALGFDSVDGSRIGAGAPRFSIEFADGSYLYPSAAYCGVIEQGMTHTDFLAAAGCVVYGWTQATGFVAKTWAQWGAVLGDKPIDYVQLLIDEPGTYHLTNVVALPA